MENHVIEYKRKLDLNSNEQFEKYLREIVGFLNSDGGTLIFGIDDNGNKVGIENISDNEREKFQNKVRDSISPSVNLLLKFIYKTFDTNKIILYIEIGAGIEKPYYILRKNCTPQGVFIRQGTSTVPLSHEDIRKMLSTRFTTDLRELKSPVESLTFEYITTEYKNYKKNYELSTEKLIRNLNFVSSYIGFNYIGYIFSDQFENFVSFSQFYGLDKASEIIDKKRFENMSLFKMFMDTYNLLEIKNLTSFKIIDGVRVEQTLYDIEIVREILVNCFVHNDYETGQLPNITMYSDRIEFVNYGEILLPFDKILSGYSKYRNLNITKVFNDFDFMEQLGIGVKKTIDAYGKECFKYDSGIFIVSIPLNKTKDIPKVVSINETNGLVKNELIIFEFIVANKKASIIEIAEHTKLSIPGIRKILKRLLDKNLVEKNGQTKGSYYTIKVLE